MDSKEYQRIFLELRTLRNLYQSNVSEEDLLVVQSFLTLLRKEGLLLKSESNLSAINYKLRIKECVDESENDQIKELYYNHIKSMCDSIRKTYIGPLYDVYLKISDYFIDNYAQEFIDQEIKTAISSRRVNAGDAMQPMELTALLNSFCDKENTVDYYNPFAGLASLSLILPKHIDYRGEELFPFPWLLGKLRMLVYDRPKTWQFEKTDSFAEWLKHEEEELYDFICFNPPFNMSYSNQYKELFKHNKYLNPQNANSLIISECFKLLRPGGKMVFLMTTGFLSSSSVKDKQLKRDLVENGHVEKIIALPSKILNHTNISVNIIVVTKSDVKQNEVEFIDASDKFNKEDGKLHTIQLIETLQLIEDESSKLKRKIVIDEIASNDYNLSVNRYVFEDLGLNVEEKKSLVKLKNLIKPISRKRAEVPEGKFVRIRDLADNTVDYIKSFNDLEEIELRPYVNLLENDTLLVATTWKSLKPTLFQGDSGNIFYDSSTILASKVDETIIDKEYLILELQKEYVQSQIEQRRTGTAVTRISRKDFLDIEIVVPTLEVQNKRKYSFKEAIIKEHQDKFKELMQEYGIDVADENSFLRHKIAGTLKNLRGSFTKLKNIIDNQIANKLPEVYNFKVDERLDSNFLDYLNRMERDLNSILGSVQAAGIELSLHEKKLETINFLKFIENYVTEVQNRKDLEFNISLQHDEDALREYKVKEVNIRGNKELLHQAFDNIIENAERHAFVHDRNNIIQVYIRFDFSAMNLVVEFANNGIQLPKAFSVEKFLRKGSKSNLKGGNGMGGWMIHEIMKKHNGNLSITDYSNSEIEIITGVLLTFPIEIKV